MASILDHVDYSQHDEPEDSVESAGNEEGVDLVLGHVVAEGKVALILGTQREDKLPASKKMADIFRFPLK